MRKKIISIGLITIILLSIITGCKIQSIDEHHKISEKDSIENDLKNNINDDVDVGKKNEKKESGDIQKTESKQEIEKNTTDISENNRDIEYKSSGSTKTSTTKSNKNSSDSNNSINQKSSTTKTNAKETNNTSSKPKETPANNSNNKKYVTLTIRCDTILNNRDKLDPNLNNERFVPSNGVILQKTKFELEDNQSVFDILVKATRKYRIHMEYQGANQNKYASVYVQGINNVYEFSCGELSGWMYNVNGNYPNIGCDKYILKGGENIEWRYTCDLGRDLGVNWIK
ncbi:MAG: DUF4430 domain-containing protein [Tissierellia bacterium]|nr:DUF4430 domain-containing protein [Tissierellia bacterium]